MAIAKVQSAVHTSLGASTPLAAAITSVKAGDSLIVVSNMQGSTSMSITGITDSASQTWIKLGATPQNTSYVNQDSEVWWLPSAKVGTHTLSIAYTGTTYGTTNTGLWISEFSGISAVDVAFAITTGTNATLTATSASASVAGDLCLMIANSASYGNVATQPSSPWTNETTPGQLIEIYPAWQIMPSTAGVTGTWTTGGSDGWAVYTILFKPAALSMPRQVMSNAVSRAANFFKRESGLYAPERGFLIPEAA